MKPRQRAKKSSHRTPKASVPSTSSSSAVATSVTTTRALPSLPTEIIDIIVGICLAPPYSDNKALSLVCRAWAPLVAARIFARRRWPKCEHFWTSKRRVPRCVCASEQPRLPALRTYLQGADRVRHALRELEITLERVPGGARPDAPGYMPMGCLNMEELFGVLEVIPNLRRLKVGGVCGHSNPTTNRAAGQALRTLEELELSNTLHLDQYAFAGLISFFGSIRSIVLVDILIGLPEEPVPLPFPDTVKTRVGSLKFVDCPTSTVKKYAEAMQVVVDAGSLLHLDLGFISDDSVGDFVASLLDDAANLEVLAFAIQHWLSPLEDSSERPVITKLLRHCMARRVVIGIRLRRDLGDSADGTTQQDIRECVRQLDWSILDDVVVPRGSPEVLQLVFTPARTQVGAELDVSFTAVVQDVLKAKVSSRSVDLIDVGVAS